MRSVIARMVVRRTVARIMVTRQTVARIMVVRRMEFLASQHDATEPQTMSPMQRSDSKSTRGSKFLKNIRDLDYWLWGCCDVRRPWRVEGLWRYKGNGRFARYLHNFPDLTQPGIWQRVSIAETNRPFAKERNGEDIWRMRWRKT